MAELALAENDLGRVKPEYNEARSLGYPDAKLERLMAIWLARIGRFSEAEPVLTLLFSEQAGSDPAVDEALARVYLKTYRLALQGRHPPLDRGRCPPTGGPSSG